jgi:hypothetical protein
MHEMKSPSAKLARILKTVKTLGLSNTANFAWYQVSLKIGLQRYLTPFDYRNYASDMNLMAEWQIPTRNEYKKIMLGKETELAIHTNEIMAGYFRMFGDALYPISTETMPYKKHWTKHLDSYVGGADVKYSWEPGRFGWATTLARAYYLTNNEELAEKFWMLAEEFFINNSVNRGPQWASAQEVAIRLVALAFSFRLFKTSIHSTPVRQAWFAKIVTAHALRIPPSLAYAKAQNNNHLLTEAVGLYTASVLLPNYWQAKKWKRQGKKLVFWCIENQILDDGTYVQHSTNYHRLMLQAILWFKMILESSNEEIPQRYQEKIASAIQWLSSLVDKESGLVTNIGSNDGAYYLPISIQPFSDYRPVLNTAENIFVNKANETVEKNDEMAYWLASELSPVNLPNNKNLLIIKGKDSWGYLRAEKFSARPSHADQNHFDLWWKGNNIAMDAGSYLYNAPPPWENQLTGTALHNTITINGEYQMTRASRFLWLDWSSANGKMISSHKMSASHNSYQKFGVNHTRDVELIDASTWVVTDHLELAKNEVSQNQIDFSLFWLLPNWEYEFKSNKLILDNQDSKFDVTIESESKIVFDIVIGGENRYGEKSNHQINRGWVSPTYGLKTPAISICASGKSELLVKIKTIFRLDS